MLGIAVIGAGHWGPNLIANFHNRRRSEVRWVVDRDARRLEVAKSRFPELAISESVEPALADPAVDAIVVATPTSTHYDVARRALEAGKHVLVEKPLADSVENAAALCEFAERQGRTLMVGHVFVFNPAARAVKAYIDAGELGRVYYLAMTRTNLGPIRVDVNAAWDLAAHDISIAAHWLGSDPLSVSATGGAWINPGVEDAVFATLRFPGEVLVQLHASWLHPRKTRDITVVGDRRMLTFDDVSLSEPIRIYDKQVLDDRAAVDFVDSFSSFRMSVRDGSITVPRVQMSEPLRNECEHFIDCIEQGQVPETSGAEGLMVVRVLDAISRSLASGGERVEVGCT